MAVSLGYFDTLMSASAASTSSELSETELAVAGQSQGVATKLALVALFQAGKLLGSPRFNRPIGMWAPALSSMPASRGARAGPAPPCLAPTTAAERPRRPLPASTCCASAAAMLPPLSLRWRAAGISHGLVRISVGLTGSPQQRLQQLEEAWLHMARHPATAVPAYKAVQVSGRAKIPAPSCAQWSPVWPPISPCALLPSRCIELCSVPRLAPRSQSVKIELGCWPPKTTADHPRRDHRPAQAHPLLALLWLLPG